MIKAKKGVNACLSKGGKGSFSKIFFNPNFHFKLGLASGLFSIHYSFSIPYQNELNFHAVDTAVPWMQFSLINSPIL